MNRQERDAEIRAAARRQDRWVLLAYPVVVIALVWGIGEALSSATYALFALIESSLFLVLFLSRGGGTAVVRDGRVELRWWWGIVSALFVAGVALGALVMFSWLSSDDRIDQPIVVATPVLFAVVGTAMLVARPRLIADPLGLRQRGVIWKAKWSFTWDEIDTIGPRPKSTSGDPELALLVRAGADEYGWLKTRFLPYRLWVIVEWVEHYRDHPQDREELAGAAGLQRLERIHAELTEQADPDLDQAWFPPPRHGATQADHPLDKRSPARDIERDARIRTHLKWWKVIALGYLAFLTLVFPIPFVWSPYANGSALLLIVLAVDVFALEFAVFVKRGPVLSLGGRTELRVSRGHLVVVLMLGVIYAVVGVLSLLFGWGGVSSAWVSIVVGAVAAIVGAVVLVDPPRVIADEHGLVRRTRRPFAANWRLAWDDITSVGPAETIDPRGAGLMSMPSNVAMTVEIGSTASSPRAILSRPLAHPMWVFIEWVEHYRDHPEDRHELAGPSGAERLERIAAELADPSGKPTWFAPPRRT